MTKLKWESSNRNLKSKMNAERITLLEVPSSQFSFLNKQKGQAQKIKKDNPKKKKIRKNPANIKKTNSHTTEQAAKSLSAHRMKSQYDVVVEVRSGGQLTGTKLIQIKNRKTVQRSTINKINNILNLECGDEFELELNVLVEKYMKL